MQPAEGRLRELKEALLLGDPVDERLRFELVGLIEYLAASLPHSRGRPQDAGLRIRAGVVGILHEQHGMKLELALNVAAEGATDADRARDRESLRATYRRLRGRGETVRVPERAVVAALSAAVKNKRGQ